MQSAHEDPPVSDKTHPAPSPRTLSVPLPFEDAIAAALETPPEPEDKKPFGKRAGPQRKEKVRSTKK